MVRRSRSRSCTASAFRIAWS